MSDIVIEEPLIAKAMVTHHEFVILHNEDLLKELTRFAKLPELESKYITVQGISLDKIIENRKGCELHNKSIHLSEIIDLGGQWLIRGIIEDKSHVRCLINKVKINNQAQIGVMLYEKLKAV